MKPHIDLKYKAIKLRKKGLSYKEIQKQVPVAKSTLSYWLKTVLLKKEYRDRLYTKKVHALSLGSQSQKERRARDIDKIVFNAKKAIKLLAPPSIGLKEQKERASSSQIQILI